MLDHAHDHHTHDQSAMTNSKRIFEILASLTSDGSKARLGRLMLPGRKQIETPNFLAVTSRGALPHITPDNLKKYTSVGSVYMGLEDLIDCKNSPIFSSPKKDIPLLHSFTSMPSDVVTILGPRRCPPVTTPVGNTVKTISIFTSTGFRNVTVPEYCSAVESLRPDIVLPLADLPHTSTTPVAKKLRRMTEHTEIWIDEFFKNLPGDDYLSGLGVSVFAPVLPVEYPIQWDYLRHLSEDAIDDLSGLAIYSTNIIPDLINYPPLTPLPKLSMDPPKSPHKVLRQVCLGVDVCILPFVNSISDAGIAMSFSFPPPADKDDIQPLGINMWSPEHSTAVLPLADGCECHACTKHHRAYIQHLLNAKEMLGWNLLQIHNHYVVDRFFAGIRETLKQGVDVFEQAVRLFSARYDSEFPEGTGERPRARGYHFKSEAGQEKFNKPGWTADLDERSHRGSRKNSNVTTPSGDGHGQVLMANVDGDVLTSSIENDAHGNLVEK